jgi:hypothetical protein
VFAPWLVLFDVNGQLAVFVPAWRLRGRYLNDKFHKAVDKAVGKAVDKTVVKAVVVLGESGYPCLQSSIGRRTIQRRHRVLRALRGARGDQLLCHAIPTPWMDKRWPNERVRMFQRLVRWEYLGDAWNAAGRPLEMNATGSALVRRVSARYGHPPAMKQAPARPEFVRRRKLHAKADDAFAMKKSAERA